MAPGIALAAKFASPGGSSVRRLSFRCCSCAVQSYGALGISRPALNIARVAIHYVVLHISTRTFGLFIAGSLSRRLLHRQLRGVTSGAIVLVGLSSNSPSVHHLRNLSGWC